jgi:hypothetical protein
MSGLVNPGDSGKSNKDILVGYALDHVEGMLKDGFEKAYRNAQRMVGVLNAVVEEAQRTRDPQFRDIFVSQNHNFYTGPFEVAVISDLSASGGVRLCILGVEVNPNDAYDDGRINKNLIPYGKEAKAFKDFQNLLDGHKLPIGGFNQLKTNWGRRPGSSYEIGGVGIKTVPGVIDITAEVEAFLEERTRN